MPDCWLPVLPSHIVSRGQKRGTMRTPIIAGTPARTEVSVPRSFSATYKRKILAEIDATHGTRRTRRRGPDSSSRGPVLIPDQHLAPATRKRNARHQPQPGQGQQPHAQRGDQTPPRAERAVREAARDRRGTRRGTGKSLRALATDVPQERRRELNDMLDAHVEQFAGRVGVQRACNAFGVNPRTYRHRRQARQG